MSAFHEFHPLAGSGFGLSKAAFLDPAISLPLISAGIGAIRADDLSEEDKKTFARHYDMDSDANFMARNAGRSALGGLAGATIGGLVGGAILGDTAGLLGSLAGGLYGTVRAGDKYTKSEARKLRDYKTNKS